MGEGEGGGSVGGIGGGSTGTGGGSPATRPLGPGQGPTKSKYAKKKRSLIHVGYRKDRKAKGI